VLGVGTGNLQDGTMELLADKGNGKDAGPRRTPHREHDLMTVKVRFRRRTTMRASS
jgi:hypothetical protein